MTADFSPKNIQIFALIFTAILLLHAPLLRLPYYWDEAGYYIPAAYDFFTHGYLIPHSVPSNAHPPLPAIYLAMWWKLSAFKPSVTRIAMLLVATFALAAVFWLARRVANGRVAFATLVCTAIYPVWFAQSSLAHADLPAAALLLWGLYFYFRSLLGKAFDAKAGEPVAISKELAAEERRTSRRDAIWAAVLFALAALAKETAIVTPLVLAGYDFLRKIMRREKRNFWRPILLVISALPLAAWFAYHGARTGFVFGNPEFFAYNVSRTLTPLRFALSLALRLWQIFGYMNLWVLTLATIWVMRYPPQQDSRGGSRPRIPLAIQYRIGIVILANILLFSAVGGAALARYLLPMYPLAILIGVSTLWRRLPNWEYVIALALAGFLLALFSNPFGYIPPEDNLSYRNYVILHKEAADYLVQHDPHATVLTAWTATDELTKPFLGYVHRSMQVARIEDFSLPQIERAREREDYDFALLFSTKQEPSGSLLDRWPWWERMSRKYFGFHRDLPPELAAQLLGGRLVWEQHRGQQWAAIVGFDRVQNASNRLP